MRPSWALTPSILRLLRAHVAVLAFTRPGPLSPSEDARLGLIHAIGLVALARSLGWPWPAAAGVLVALVLAGIVLLRLRLSLAQLAWLLPVYLILGLRFLYLRALNQPLPGYYDYLLPDLRLPFLYPEPALVAACLLAVLSAMAARVRSKGQLVRVVAVLVLFAAAAWAGARYVGRRTHGATGSDPFAYAQMGADIAAYGTPVLRLPLFREIVARRLAWYPVVPVGYHLPMNESGEAVSVWPPGAGYLYALGFLIFGEAGLYLVNPLFSLAGALLAGLLAWELGRDAGGPLRALAAAVTAALVATANEQAAWSVVPMADAMAQVFSTLTLYAALRAGRSAHAGWPLAAGASLGAAYCVRHTQLVLMGPLVLLLALGLAGPRLIRGLVWAALASLLVALPDLWYHQLYLGGWLHPESEELALFSAGAVGDSASRLFQSAFAGYEFGWLVPLLVLGAWDFARRARVGMAALSAWVALALLFHLPYAALRLRDLLPEFPAVAFLAAWGLVALLRPLAERQSWKRRAAAGLLLLCALDLLLLRAWNTVPQAWQPLRGTFGYVTQAQRAAFYQLAALTPGDAVIGATLNSGAVQHYTGRSSFRPEGWSPADRREFLLLMLKSHSGVYVLEDSRALDPVLAELRQEFRVELAAQLDLPLFGDSPPDSPGVLWKIMDH